MAESSRQNLFLGLESGGRKIAAAIVDEANRVVSRAEGSRRSGNRAKATLKQIQNVAEAALQQLPDAAGSLVAAGWGFGGMVDRKNNQPQVNPHEAGWEGLSSRTALESALSLPVHVINDCNAAALAEGHAGAGSLEGTMIYVTLGSGIGGGALVDGKLLEGGRFGEMELGHLPLDPELLPCPCGNVGCLESTCSGDGLGRLALHWRERFRNSVLSRELENRSPEEIAPQLLEPDTRDPLALACQNHFLELLGKAGAILVNLFNPTVLVLGGGVMQNAWLLKPLKAAIHQGVAPQLKASFEIRSAALQTDVVPLGAALYARQLAEKTSSPPQPILR